MCPGPAVLCPPAFSVKPPLRPGYDRPRLEANRQKPQRLVPVRSPLPHLMHRKSGLDTRIHELRHRVRKGIDHDRLAGGLILDVCLRAVELAIRVQLHEIERASVPQHPTRLSEGRAERLHMLQHQGGDDGIESGA